MKIKEFRKNLLKKNIDFTIFLNTDDNKRDKNIFYFTGVDVEFSCLIVPSIKKPYLMVASLEEEIARKESKVKVVVLKKKLFETIKKDFKNPKRIGVNYSKFTLAEKKALKKVFKKATLVDISTDLAKIRIQKEKDEIEKIRKACKITDDIVSKIVLNIKRFRNEKEIEEFISDEARKNDCTLAFPPIIASGKNASMPHYMKNDSPIKKGFLVMDFGVNYKGYNSDMTRTIHIGTPSEEEKIEYYRLLGVQEEAIRALKVGVDIRKIDKKVRGIVGPTMIHSLYHGLGIDVHDVLSTNPKKTILKENSVTTIEPGIYKAGKFGIRIEDDVLITKKGHEILTKSNKELIIIK